VARTLTSEGVQTDGRAMVFEEFARSAIAAASVAIMGGLTLFAAGGFDGISAASASPATTTTTLVPRPATTTEAPRLNQVSDLVVVSSPNPPTARVTTATTTDPYAWLETVPAPGQTFLGVSTQTGSLTEVESFSDTVGKSPDVVMITRSWADTATADIETVESITAAGYLPMIAWEPWDHRVESTFDRRRGEQPDYSLARILDGDFDPLIESWAEGLAEWGRPVVIRFAHEMNGYWYPWAESSNENLPGQYVEAWRYVHDIFTAEGADNVIWVWSPNLTQPTLPALAGLYPGDEYVDWLGLVGYLGNGIDPRVYVPTFDQLFGPTMAEMREFSDKPMVVTELGATELGGKKAAWIEHVLNAVKDSTEIVGVVWFEVDKETDWRVVSSPEATAAFVEAVDDPRFGIPRN